MADLVEEKKFAEIFEKLFVCSVRNRVRLDGERLPIFELRV
jgi:hypothetical protein